MNYLWDGRVSVKGADGGDDVSRFHFQSFALPVRSTVRLASEIKASLASRGGRGAGHFKPQSQEHRTRTPFAMQIQSKDTPNRQYLQAAWKQVLIICQATAR